MTTTTPVGSFLRHHFRHFNARTLVDATDAYRKHLEAGGRMLVTLAGAMSTAELGLSLAEMIRQGKVHAICPTGANLEEDVFNLVAHDFYRRIPNYRDLTPADEVALLANHLNRVTDTCIPEAEAMRRIEGAILRQWMAADQAGERCFPSEFFFRVLRDPEVRRSFQVDVRDSWLHAAMEAGHCISGDVKSVHTVRTGIETMIWLADWYTRTTAEASIGFFQIGGGIAGDFPICVVPMLRQDLQRADTPLWGYFCQISDSTTSYGSYSGAVPNEKITWEKLSPDTPRFIIESDATIVAPLMFAGILGW